MAHVLVVDDDREIRSFCRRVLHDAGHEVAEACSGGEAADRYRASPADLIIMDVFMPDGDGLETITEIRRTHPDVKIIAMSGGWRTPPSQYLNVARVLGAAQTLAKPFDGEQLLRSVEAVLGNNRETPANP